MHGTKARRLSTAHILARRSGVRKYAPNPVRTSRRYEKQREPSCGGRSGKLLESSDISSCRSCDSRIGALGQRESAAGLCEKLGSQNRRAQADAVHAGVRRAQPNRHGKGKRDGLTVVTPSEGTYLQFDGRRGRDDIKETEPQRLKDAVATAYVGE